MGRSVVYSATAACAAGSTAALFNNQTGYLFWMLRRVYLNIYPTAFVSELLKTSGNECCWREEGWEISGLCFDSWLFDYFTSFFSPSIIPLFLLFVHCVSLSVFLCSFSSLVGEGLGG